MAEEKQKAKINVAAIPFKDAPEFLLSRFDLDPTPDDPNHKKKIPISVKTKRPFDPWAKVDRILLGTLDECLKELPKFDAIGKCITDSAHFPIDLDKCFLPDGSLKPWARQLVDRCASFTELSPSGTGLHVWLSRGLNAPLDKNKDVINFPADGGKVEIFHRGYCTVTGQVFENRTKLRALKPGELEELHRFATSLKPASVAETSVAGLVLRERTRQLLDRNTQVADTDDNSDIVHKALIALLYDTALDRKKSDEIFRQSRLFKETKWGTEGKWDRRSGEEFDKAEPKARDLILKARPKKKEEIDVAKWEEEFPALCDVKVEPCVEIVKDLLIKDGIHIFAGMFESYKTMAAIELSSAIWEKRPAFDYFPTFSSHPILYLCPDMGPGLFLEYQRPFNLTKHGEDFRVCRADADVLHSLDSAVMQRAVSGRILFVDTMLDYAHIKDGFQSGEWVEFFQKLRNLIRVHGCVAIVLIAHPTKAAGKASNTTIDPSEFLKDSVTVGGKADVAFAFKKVPNTGKVHVERIKGRFFKKREFTFSLAVEDEQLNSNLDRGRFPICDKPEDKKGYADHVERQKPGRKSDCTPEMRAEVRRLKSMGKTNAEIGKVYEVSGATVGNWLKGPQVEMF